MNHIDEIVEREHSAHELSYTPEQLRALLLEAADAYRKDAERWRAFVRMDVDVHINTCGESFCGIGFAETGLTDFVDAAIAAEGK